MWLFTLPTLFVILFADAAFAQLPVAQVDYYRNETEVKANRRSRYGTGSLWKVKVEQLNCRQELSLDSPVKQIYSNNTVLEVQIYRGGSDEVLVNPRDRNGKPWMSVRDRDSLESKCYVRANSRYIQPVTARNQKKY